MAVERGKFSIAMWIRVQLAVGFETALREG